MVKLYIVYCIVLHYLAQSLIDTIVIIMLFHGQWLERILDFCSWFSFGKPAVSHSLPPRAAHGLEICPGSLSEDDIMMSGGAPPTVHSL